LLMLGLRGCTAAVERGRRVLDNAIAVDHARAYLIRWSWLVVATAPTARVCGKRGGCFVKVLRRFRPRYFFVAPLLLDYYIELQVAEIWHYVLPLNIEKKNWSLLFLQLLNLWLCGGTIDWAGYVKYLFIAKL
jgi:hypothetical protein